MNRSLLALSPLLLLAPSAAAEVLTVGPLGSGSDFSSVVAAIGAANDGDTVFIAPGEYIETASLILDRPLTLRGSGSGVTSVRVMLEASTFNEAGIVFDGLAPGETASAIGLDLQIEGAPSAFVTTPQILIRNCTGNVLVQDAVTVVSAAFPNLGTVAVVDSENVLFENVLIQGTPGFENPGRDGLNATRSKVWIHDSEILGGGAGGAFFLFPAGRGLVAIDSVVRVSDTTVQGGAGSPTFSGGADGARAAVLQDSELILRGNSVVEGGSALLDPLAQGAAALELTQGSLLTATPDVLFVAGLDGDGTASQPALIATGGQVANVPQNLATLTSAPGLAAQGDAFTLSTSGEPGSIATVYFGAPGPALQLALPLGPVLLAPGTFAPLGAQVIPASGSVDLTLTVPTASAFAAITQRFQSLVVSPGALTSISNAAHVSVTP